MGLRSSSQAKCKVAGERGGAYRFNRTVHDVFAVLALLGLGQGELPRVAHNRLDVLYDLLKGLGRKLRAGVRDGGVGVGMQGRSGVASEGERALGLDLPCMGCT